MDVLEVPLDQIEMFFKASEHNYNFASGSNCITPSRYIYIEMLERDEKTSPTLESTCGFSSCGGGGADKQATIFMKGSRGL